MTCASTRLRLEPNAWADSGLLALIGFPHTKDVTLVAAWCVPYDNHAALKQAVADDSKFTVILARVFDFESRAMEDVDCVREV